LLQQIAETFAAITGHRADHLQSGDRQRGHALRRPPA
jgi:hypothetical protein